jgi:hypothetical protein
MTQIQPAPWYEINRCPSCVDWTLNKRSLKLLSTSHSSCPWHELHTLLMQLGDLLQLHIFSIISLFRKYKRGLMWPPCSLYILPHNLSFWHHLAFWESALLIFVKRSMKSLCCLCVPNFYFIYFFISSEYADEILRLRSSQPNFPSKFSNSEYN